MKPYLGWTIVGAAGLVAGGLFWLLRPIPAPRSAPVEDGARRSLSAETIAQVDSIRRREQRIKETLWAEEIQARPLGDWMDLRWDQLRRSKEKLQLLSEWVQGSIQLGAWTLFDRIPEHQIERYRASGSDRSLDAEGWRQWVHEWAGDGWGLETMEWRHRRFDPGNPSEPNQSELFFRAALIHETKRQRCLIAGPLSVSWEAMDAPSGIRIHHWDARLLEVSVTHAPAPFELLLETPLNPPVHAHAVDPLLVHDLDGDGRAEWVMANKNLVYRFTDGGAFTTSPLCTFSPGPISAAVFADINLDGMVDFICHKHEGLVAFLGSEGGQFDQYEIMLRPSDRETVYPMVLSAGDVDLDGDPDLFLGQYRVPYEGGSLPTPFYDADDGHPFFLLSNQGGLQFEDVTEASGLTEKRHRRIYSASLVDLDGNPGLDLVVMSDFAGVDLYLNTGTGRFQSAPSGMLGNRFGFGMAHALADWNTDGHLDLLMIGMNSPTVDRLEHSRQWRPGLTRDRTMRRHMTYGNRLFLSRGDGGFQQTSMGDSLARAGWAWGCSAADFDNDGFPDVYIGNGLESQETVTDYEPEFWLHDAFIADSEPDAAAYVYFQDKFAATRGRGHSYGGYESNRLYLNREGQSFLDIAHLWGLGFQWDTRNVVSEDLDGDGRMDLLFTHFEPWPGQREVLRVYQNRMPESGRHWIGFQVARGEGQPSPQGLRVQVRYGDHRQLKTIVSGDSYRSQHSLRLHFGLGRGAGQKAEAMIQWPDGRRLSWQNLDVNRYHTLTYPSDTASSDKE